MALLKSARGICVAAGTCLPSQRTPEVRDLDVTLTVILASTTDGPASVVVECRPTEADVGMIEASLQ